MISATKSTPRMAPPISSSCFGIGSRLRRQMERTTNQPAIEQADEQDHEDDQLPAQLGRERLPEAEQVDTGVAQELRGDHERDEHDDAVQERADDPLREAGEDAAGQAQDHEQVDQLQARR